MTQITMLVENLPKKVLPAPNVNFDVNVSLRWNRQKIPSSFLKKSTNPSTCKLQSARSPTPQHPSPPPRKPIRTLSTKPHTPSTPRNNHQHLPLHSAHRRYSIQSPHSHSDPATPILASWQRVCLQNDFPRGKSFAGRLRRHITQQMCLDLQCQKNHPTVRGR
jgi:hypothetical protein